MKFREKNTNFGKISKAKIWNKKVFVLNIFEKTKNTEFLSISKWTLLLYESYTRYPTLVSTQTLYQVKNHDYHKYWKVQVFYESFFVNEFMNTIHDFCLSNVLLRKILNQVIKHDRWTHERTNTIYIYNSNIYVFLFLV